MIKIARFCQLHDIWQICAIFIRKNEKVLKKIGKNWKKLTNYCYLRCDTITLSKKAGTQFDGVKVNKKINIIKK